MSEENNSWTEALPEGMRDAPFIGKAESMEDAIGKLAHAAQYMGTAVKMPDIDAEPEAINAFFEKIQNVPGVARLPTPDDPEGFSALMTKLGAPEEATDYKLPEVEDFDWDEGVVTQLRTVSKEAGLTNTQFQRLAENLANQEDSAASALAEVREESRKELRLEWGEALESREALIRGWMDKSEAPENLTQMFEDKALGLETMNWLYGVAAQFKGKVNPISEDGTGKQVEMDPASAREKIDELANNPAYWDATDPRHADLVKRMVKLQALANPNQAA